MSLGHLSPADRRAAEELLGRARAVMERMGITDNGVGEMNRDLATVAVIILKGCVNKFPTDGVGLELRSLADRVSCLLIAVERQLGIEGN